MYSPYARAHMSIPLRAEILHHTKRAWKAPVKSQGTSEGLLPLYIRTCSHLQQGHSRLTFRRRISHILDLLHSEYSWAFTPTPVGELKRGPERRPGGWTDRGHLSHGSHLQDFNLISNHRNNRQAEFKCQLEVLLKRGEYLTFRSAFCFLLTIKSPWRSNPCI